MTDRAQSTTNRLARETSPYLLQHAHNPVDWFPWGAEAVAEARRRGVPIFLSIGYSTCYWCHVMERESFEDAATAAVMNERFVCIKADREERPDLDDACMTACQMLTQRGGWPLSVFLEPLTLKPFYAGTYFPPRPAHGLPSFTQVLVNISEAYKDKRGEVIRQAEALAQAVREHLAPAPGVVALGQEDVGRAASALLTSFDRVNGGFSGAPKFPQPVYLEFLLDARAVVGSETERGAIDLAIRHTLDRMALGGLFDHVGGGFHRYSVDAFWTVPHFEKMLYDNAQLLSVYTRAAALYGDPFYSRTARRTADYVLREMTAPDGVFYSAQDAEVDGREGRNYLWTPDEFRAALGAEEAGWAIKVYGLDRGPNFQDPHHPNEPASNVLRLEDKPASLAARQGMTETDFLARLGTINTHLLAARNQRPQPRLDDKAIVAWNGLMIAALAEAGRSLNEPRYTATARKATDWILANMGRDDAHGRGLHRTTRLGAAKVPATLEDYAMFIDGLLACEPSPDEPSAPAEGFGAITSQAEHLAGQVLLRFRPDPTSGYLDAEPPTGDEPPLFVSGRSTHDGAIPCGASVMLHNWITLAERSKDPDLLDAALADLAAMSHAVSQSPVSTINTTRGLLRLLLIDQGRVGASLRAAGATERAAPVRGTGSESVVEVFADHDEQIALSPGTPHELKLRVRVKEGYHLIAADPGDGPDAEQELEPTRVGIVGGGGLAAYCDYPAGTPYGEGGRLRVYTGDIELPIAVELTGSWTGSPRLAMSFQACGETECLAPATIIVDVDIVRTAAR